ncbi:MAG TPA: hypothetical protein PLS12_09050 [Bacteroidales bacterium]|nr:hypothetical protein [Bacteroidales bacterium]
MSNISYKIQLSWSKIMALVILIIGSAYSFITKDASVITVTIPTCAAMIGYKQYQQIKTTQYDKPI